MLTLDDMAQQPPAPRTLDNMAESTAPTDLDKMAEYKPNEAPAWEQFRYAFDREGNIASYAADILERYMPLGKVTFNFTEGFNYIPPDEAYGEGFKEAPPEQRREMIYEAKQQQLEEKYGEGMESDGVAEVMGALAKGVLDPVNLLPFGMSIKGAAASGAGLGATYSVLQDEATTGNIDPQKALRTAAVGGVLAPATVVGARVLGNKMRAKSNTQTFKKAQQALDAAVAQGKKVDDMPAVLKEFGVDPVKAFDAASFLGAKYKIPANASRAKQAIRDSVTVDSAASRVYSRGLDKYLGALSTRVRNISEPVFGRLRKYEYDIHRNTQAKGKEVEPFLMTFNKLQRGARESIARKLYNGEFDSAEAMMRSVDPRLVEEFKNVKSVLSSTGDELVESGHLFEKIPDYFPRVVKDVDGLLESLGTTKKSRIEKALSDYAKAKRTSVGNLSTQEEAEIIDLVVRGYRLTTDGGKPRFLKPRAVEKIAPEQMKFYASADESLHRYLRGAVNDIEKRKFFGRAATSTAGRLDDDASIGSFIAKEIEDGAVPSDKQDELAELLTARFVSGDIPSSGVIGGIRSLGYMGTIANPISAITQLGDLGIASAMKGMRGTLRSLFGSKDARLIDIGLDQVVTEEFRDANLMSNLLNKTLTLGGFRAVDRVGKETFINAALRKAKALSKSPKGVESLRKDWGGVFGDEFDGLVEDLRAGHMTDNVKFLLFNELSDIQPVNLSEMPQAYLENPNGRILYMLKSFTLKQYDLARRQIVQQWKKGNKQEAVKNAVRLAGYMTAANTGTGLVKDFLLGREVRPDDIPSHAMWALLGVYGLNEYTSERYLQRGDVKGAVVNQLVPATPIIDAAFKLGTEIPKDDPQIETTLRAIPVVGPMVYAWFGGGAEKYNERLD